MPIAKRRKVTAPALRTLSTTAGITAFTQISKAQACPKPLLDKNDLASQAITTPAQKIDFEDRKRNADVAEIDVDEEVDTCATTILASAINAKRVIKPLPKRISNAFRQTYETPKNSKLVEVSPVSADTTTKGARELFQCFKLSSSPAQLSSSPLFSQSTNDTSYISSQDLHSEHELPSELQDLINLHSSFLTALSLHYAHNGTHTPADLRLLCADIARAWGKRRVMLDDIRRILAVLNSTSTMDGFKACADLSLSDYGHGKICIEIKTASGRAGNIARPIDENHMNDRFTSNLCAMWSYSQVDDDDATRFINDLALEPIKICSSLTKMSPLLAKGQRRLEDMRASVLAKRDAITAAKIPVSSITNVGTKKLTLLERLQAKQRQAASQPPPPSKADLSRQAGLHRIDEVVAVLTLLTTSTSVGQSRVSFTLPTVLGKLKDSFKTPMSREEGEVCVRLLADEIAPEWLRVVKMKRVEQVIVVREARPSNEVIGERVTKAITA